MNQSSDTSAKPANNAVTIPSGYKIGSPSSITTSTGTGSITIGPSTGWGLYSTPYEQQIQYGTVGPEKPKLIYTKMSHVMRDIGPVTKDQKNTAQGYKFRGVDQFVNALHPALVKHGVIMTAEVLEREEVLKEVERSSGKKGVDKHVSLKVRYTFLAEDGSSVSSIMVGEGLDSSDKATNKALSAALKYALIQTFSVPTEDMEEADSESPEIGVSSSAATPEAPKEEKKRSSFRKADLPAEEKVTGWT